MQKYHASLLIAFAALTACGPEAARAPLQTTARPTARVRQVMPPNNAAQAEGKIAQESPTSAAAAPQSWTPGHRKPYLSLLHKTTRTFF